MLSNICYNLKSEFNNTHSKDERREVKEQLDEKKLKKS